MTYLENLNDAWVRAGTAAGHALDSAEELRHRRLKLGSFGCTATEGLHYPLSVFAAHLEVREGGGAE